MATGFLVGDEEADVGYWTGILGALSLFSSLRSTDCAPFYVVSTFFLTQFLTSLLWVSRLQFLCLTILMILSGDGSGPPWSTHRPFRLPPR